MADSRDEAESWAQDVWVRVWERLGTFRAESAFSSWLHRICVNVVLDRKRSANRGKWLVDLDAADGVARDHADSKGFGAEGRVDLARAVERLPEGAKTVFLLHDVEGFKHREIAVRLGVAEGTVKAQLHRARRLLREIMSR
jgi:RNA polymerase sigma-70 factor (ECF subfamily)